jgi:uncharacterized membrane protein
MKRPAMSDVPIAVSVPELTERDGDQVAVDGLTFDVPADRGAMVSDRELGRSPVPKLLLPPRSTVGWVLGMLWFAGSVVPSLLPRSSLVQGVMSGVAFGIGYGLGRVAAAVGRGLGHTAPARWGAERTEIRWVRGPAIARGAIGVVTLGLSSAIVVWALFVHQRWHTDVRGLMGLEARWYHWLELTGVALLTAALLLVLGRIVTAAHHAYVRGVDRVVPRRGRRPWRVLIALTLVVVSVDVVLAGWTVDAVRDGFIAADARYDTKVARPGSTLRSGGPGSYLAWEELGRMGRSFTGAGPSTEQLSAYTGTPARQPIRVYVGLESAKTARGRAELAVDELERTGAFDREILLMVVPTGTGWVDPSAIAPLEYLYGGDTAAVAIQYSYQPSWVTMMGNQDRAVDGARALLAAVTTRLEMTSPPSRPRLLLYGQSLGAFGSGRLFASLDEVPEDLAGILWAGTPSATPLWRDLVADRDPGSPMWAPVFQGGRQVRFGANGATLPRPEGSWEEPRIVFLQNATDPIVWWRPSLLFERPEWMDAPRGPGVSQTMPFVPIVTGLQVGLDLLQSMNVPPGHGHVFGSMHAEAWVQIVPPSGWTSADTTRLLATIDA